MSESACCSYTGSNSIDPADANGIIDEILELFRTSTAITGDLTESLLESIRNAKEFSVAVDKFQLKAKASLDEQLSQSKDAFGRLMLNIQNAVQRLLGVMNEGVDDAAEKLSGLEKV
jgi:ABC-type transporter Mla subunit MlaD